MMNNMQPYTAAELQHDTEVGRVEVERCRLGLVRSHMRSAAHAGEYAATIDGNSGSWPSGCGARLGPTDFEALVRRAVGPDPMLRVVCTTDSPHSLRYNNCTIRWDGPS